MNNRLYKGLRHIADVRPSPQSWSSRIKLFAQRKFMKSITLRPVCRFPVSFIIRINKVGKFSGDNR